MADPTGPNEEPKQAGGGPADERAVSESGPSPTDTRVVRVKRSIWDDRRVRAMAYGATAIVVLYLLTVISLLYFGFVGESAPRTATERDVIVRESIVRSGEATATIDQWQSYVLSLVADSQHQRAQTMIDEIDANTALDQSMGQNMLYSTAVLRQSQGRLDEALELYIEVMDLTLEVYEEELRSGNEPNWAMAFGLHNNYYQSATARAGIYGSREQWDEAIEMLDIYLEAFPRSAGILADRALMKAESGDVEGAEADYREALRYDPELVDAHEGLEQIGVGE